MMKIMSVLHSRKMMNILKVSVISSTENIPTPPFHGQFLQLIFYFWEEEFIWQRCKHMMLIALVICKYRSEAVMDKYVFLTKSIVKRL